MNSNRFQITVFISLSIFLNFLTLFFYSNETPGIPDSCPVETTIIPFYFFKYAPSFGSGVILVWFFSCLTFYVPSLYASFSFYLHKNSKILILLAGQTMWALFQLSNSPYIKLIFNADQPKMIAFNFLFHTIIWFISLQLFGFISGYTLFRIDKLRK